MISKQKFLKTLDKYPPNKYTEFIYINFGLDTTMNKYKWGFLLIFIILNVFGIYYDQNNMILTRNIFIYTFTAIFMSLIISSFICRFLNHRRVRKIMNELNLVEAEYYKLLDLYTR